jgi:protein phosphatase 2C-like protein
VTTAQDDGGTRAVPVQALPWQVHVASVVGAGHVRDGRPNQDSVGRRPLTQPDGSAVLAAAVADGHGDSRHFRSGRGSAMAIAAGLAAVEAWTVPAAAGAGAVRDSAERERVSDIIARWNAAVEADLSAHPFSEAEAAVLGRESLPDVIAYGSTLLVAVLTAEFAVFTQIGDGDIVAVRPDGQSLLPVPADDSLDGWLTTSLCQVDAEESFRTGVVALADNPLFAVLLATDGFSNAQADDPWPPGFALDLAQLGHDHEPGWFASQLPGWAEQCASVDGSGDDSTMALVISSTVRPGPGAAPREAGLHSRTEPSRTIQLPSPAARQSPTLAGQTLPGQPRPSYSGTGQPGPGQPAAGSGRAGGDPGFFQQFRVRLLWLAAAIVVILGGTGLAFVLTGNSQGGPAPHTRPTHQVSARPSPSAAASSSRASQRPHNQHRHRHLPKKTKQQARSRT